MKPCKTPFLHVKHLPKRHALTSNRHCAIFSSMLTSFWTAKLKLLMHLTIITVISITSYCARKIEKDSRELTKNASKTLSVLLLTNFLILKIRNSTTWKCCAYSFHFYTATIMWNSSPTKKMCAECLTSTVMKNSWQMRIICFKSVVKLDKNLKSF
jgi:hypothetical protein